MDSILFGCVMTLKLDEEPRFAALVLAERLSVPLRLANGRFVVGVVVGLRVVQEVVRDRAAQVPVDRNQTLGPFAQRGLVHPRPVVEAVDKRIAAELDEVLPSGVVLGEQNEVVTAVGDAAAGSLVPVARGHVRLDAENRFDPCCGSLGIQLDRPMEVAMVGHGYRIHPQLANLLDQRTDAIRPVQQRVFAVQVQVNKSRCGRCIHYLVFVGGGLSYI